MEIDNSLEKYIQITDNVFKTPVIEVLLKICKESDKFKDAELISYDQDKLIDKNVRKTKFWPLQNIGPKSLTEVHWTNLLMKMFTESIKKYSGLMNTNVPFNVIDIQVLKYGVGGHYIFHVDHSPKIPRTYSCIFFVNDDYEGGDLIFKFPLSKKELKVNKLKNRLIIWPSNFLFPHTVTPIIKGERYSIVSWAL